MNVTTGRALPDELAHIKQSVADILLTPVGSRVMRRDYGSFIPELIDQPLNGETVLRLYAATVMALLRWEPRVKLSRVHAVIDASAPGSLALDLIGARVGSAEPLTFSVPLRAGSGA
ncbi:MAG: GPW/gp25 family protein [Pseudomonas sp.]|uniref:GPW/gp25 family protein n=1 Tax=Pseudomonas sp. TaxID=306 RepID=UPI0033963373